MGKSLADTEHLVRSLVVAAVVVLGASAAAAIVFGPACPSGWHTRASVWCETDAMHVAPSSGVMIHNATMPRPSRTRLRVEILVVGVLVAGTLLWFGLVEIDPGRSPETELAELPD